MYKTSIYKLTNRYLKLLLVLAIVFSVVTPFKISYAKSGVDTTSITSFVAYYTNVDAGVQFDSGVKRDGTTSIKMYNRTQKQDGNVFMVYQKIPVEQGKNYECGLSVKGENVNTASLVFSNWDLYNSLKPFGSTFDWIDLKFNYTHKRNSGNYDFQIMLSDKATAFWVDNVYVYELDENGNRVGENIIKNGSFEKKGTGAKKAVGNGDSGNNILLEKAPDNLKIDGKLDEWKNKQAHDFKAAKMHYLGGQPHNMDADIRFLFDEKYLYFAIKVYDPIHFSQNVSNYWSVDSVQYVVSSSEEAYGKELGLIYEDSSGGSFSYGQDGVIFKGSREGEETTYEVAVPWSVRGWKSVPDKLLFGAIINNSNGHGRVGTVEYTTGISSVKSNTGFVQLIPFDENTGCYVTIEPNGEVKAGEPCEFMMLIINGYKESQDINVIIPEIKFNETFKVKGGGTYTAVFEQTMEKSGKIPLTLVTNIKNQKKEAVKEIDVLPNNEVIMRYCDDLDEKCRDLEKRIYECSKEGHYVDYELTNLSIIKLYEEYLKDDMAHSIYNYASNTYNGLVNIYNETVNNLNAYVSGEKVSHYVPKMKNIESEIDGSSFVADVEMENGEIKKQPVFYLGVNKRGNPIPSESWDDVALNIYTVEIDPRYGITKDKKILCYNVSNEDLCEITEEEVASGKYALKISASENETVTLKQSINFDNLHEYEIKFKAKGENVKNAYVMFGDKAKQEISGTFDWTEYTIYTKAGAMEMSRTLTLSCSGADNLYFDDVSVREIGGGYERVDNGGFEMGYGGTSELGYVFVDSYAERINYMINEQIELGMPIHLSCPWYLNDEVKALLSEKDPAFNEYGKLNRAHQNHPLWLEYATYFITEFMERIENKDALFSVCLYNEPHHATNYEWYRPLWSEYLKEVYGGNIEKLNKSYESSYISFDEVPLPESAATNDSNYFNDYMRFNNKMLADFMRELICAFKKVAPDVKCEVKIMEYVFKADKRLNYGNDYEAWSDLFEINGCDSYSYKDLSSYPIASRLQWFDFLTSNKNAPIFDSELHIIPDGVKNVYNDDIKKYSVADRWQCSIHKMGATQIWLFDRAVDTYRMQHIFDSTNLSLMPELFAGFAKQQNDLLRLSNEVTAIQNKKAEAAILFSHTAIQKNPKYTGDLHSVYTNLLYSGEKVFVMNETRPEQLLENGIKLLVLPGATHVSKNTVDAIKRFIEQGGIVIMTENDLKFDPHNNPQDKATLDFIYNNAVVVKKAEGEDETQMIKRMVKSGVDKCGLSEIKLVYAENGEPVDNIEYEYTEYNGKMLLNICNYDWNSEKLIDVYYNGQKATELKDLITDKIYKDSVLVEPYIPVLLQF